MSKKKKNKFKKSKHGNKHTSHHAFSTANPAPPIAPVIDKTVDNSLPDTIPDTIKDNQTEETKEVVEVPEKEDNRYEYVKKDVKKIVLSILGLFVLMAIIYFLNQKFLFLQSFGDWIYKIANFQI